MGEFAARQAPAGTRSTTWHDAEGAHLVEIGSSGVFEPTTASEEAHAVSLGWPTAKRAAANTAKPPKPAPEPAAPPADEAGKETE